MAKVILSYVFADGDQVQAIASGDLTYPDALAQLRHEAVEGFKEMLAYTLAVQSVDTEGES